MKSHSIPRSTPLLELLQQRKKHFVEPHVFHNAYNFVGLCTMPRTSVRIWPTIRMTPFYYPIQCTWAKFWTYIIEDFTEHYMYSNLWKRCRTGITSFNLSLSYIFSWTYYYSIHDFKWEFAPAFRFCFRSHNDRTVPVSTPWPGLDRGSLWRLAFEVRFRFQKWGKPKSSTMIWIYGYMIYGWSYESGRWLGVPWF